MRRIISAIYVAMLFIVLSANGLSIKEGKHYQKLVSPCEKKCQGKVDIAEYFTFGCPSCYKLEQDLVSWLKNKPKNVIFTKVPLTLGSKILRKQAEGYYIAKIYGKERKYIDHMFKKIHRDNKAMSSEGTILELLGSIGIEKAKALETMNSFSLKMKIEENEEKMIKSKIFAMPTFVIGGKYKTDPNIAGGFDRYWDVVEHIVAKVEKENKVSKG